MDSMSERFVGGSVRMRKRKKNHHKPNKPASNFRSSPPPPYEQLPCSDEEKDERRSKRRKRDGDQSSTKTSSSPRQKVTEWLGDTCRGPAGRLTEYHSNATSASGKEAEYQYSEIKPGDIRILTVHSGSGGELDCTLTVRKDEEYEALSYVWGNEKPSEKIRIRTEGDPMILNITKTLLSALKRLRYPHTRRVFWVDAVCINQKSNWEKNHQVPLMAKIYENATNVCIWLGDPEDNAAHSRDHEDRGSLPPPQVDKGPLALALIQKIRYLRDYDGVVEDGTECREWEALIELMKRPWFSRRWVVQEIALARDASLHSGKWAIQWTEFADAVALFEQMADRVRKKFKASPEYNNHPDFIGDVKNLSASRLVGETTNIVRRKADGTISKKNHSLESLVSRLTPFEASSSHDIIYSLLSLAKDVPGSEALDGSRKDTAERKDSAQEGEELIDLDPRRRQLLLRVTASLRVKKYPVDYAQSFYEVCRDFMEFATRKSRSLDMICRPWVRHCDIKSALLPSWIRSLEHKSHGKDRDGNYTRVYADSLVGQPEDKTYCASGRYPPEWTFSTDPEIRSLTVKGFLLDVVARRRETALSGNIPKKWLEFAGWKCGEEIPPEEFWRTIVADRGPYGRVCPGHYIRACQEAFQEKAEGGDLNPGRIIDRLNSTIMTDFLRRVESVVWGRRLIRTEVHRFLGLAPSDPIDTKKGDLICILAGCSVPVILRRKGLNEQTGKDFYKLVGECYIHGMMDGEAFEIKKKDNHSFQNFEIR